MDWISVKERLPEDNKPVLTCDHDGNINIMRHTPGSAIPFNIDQNNIWYWPVKYWMPLPESPDE